MRVLPLLLLLAATAACSQTRYVEYGDAAEPPPVIGGRTVGFDVDDEFYRDPPTCIAMTPLEQAAGETGLADAARVETTFARHLAGRVRRVVDADSAADCRYKMVLRPWKTDRLFAVVWTRRQVGLEAELVRIGDGKVMWRARHVDRRSGGGVPLSPVAAMGAAFDALGLMSDGEDSEQSMLDDVCRRLVVTMPDARQAVETIAAVR